MSPLPIIFISGGPASESGVNISKGVACVYPLEKMGGGNVRSNKPGRRRRSFGLCYAVMDALFMKTFAPFPEQPACDPEGGPDLQYAGHDSEVT